MSLNEKTIYGSIAFVTSEYECREDKASGKCFPSQAQPTTKCPHAHQTGDTSPCCIIGDGTRIRKFPKRFHVIKMKCRTHGCHFTVYPPGLNPYARHPVVELDPSGHAIKGETEVVFSQNIIDVISEEPTIGEAMSNIYLREGENEFEEPLIAATEEHLSSTLFLQSFAEPNQ